MSPTNDDFHGTDRFEIKRLIGVGGMGEVYEAFDRERGHLVALKTLKHPDARSLVRFKREFRALHDVHHPNVIRLYELFQEVGYSFFTMELLWGESFLEYVGGADRPPSDTQAWEDLGGAPTGPAHASPEEEQQGGYDEARLRDAMKQLVLGVHAVHLAGHVHRDIKPSNILVTGEGQLVLLDFGLATTVAADGQSAHSRILGTAQYMAPEQASAADVSAAADWYSVGVLLYEALTGRLPHTGANAIEMLMAKQQREPPPPRACLPGVPRDLDELCVALLQRDPNARPSATRILDAVGADLGESRGARRISTSSEFPRRAPTERTEDPRGVEATEETAFLETTHFVGREQEMAALRLLFDEHRKRPVVHIIEGGSGVGKTELVQQFCWRMAAERPDLVVLSGRCYERESVAYKAVDGIADSLSRFLVRLDPGEAAALMPLEAALLPRLFPVLQRVDAIADSPSERDSPDVQEQRRRMFAAFRELLLRIAMRRPTIVTIDDLQWTDMDSLLLLQEVLGGLDAPGLLVLVTMRPMDKEKRAPIMSVLRGMDVRIRSLAPLGVAQSQSLVDLLLPDLDSATAATIAREALGQPLFVQEMCRFVAVRGDAAGLSLEQVLGERLSVLSAEETAVLEMICVAGAPVVQDVAAWATELDFGDFARAVTTLRAERLVRTGGARTSDTIEPYHDRVRETITRRLAPDRTRHCHGRLAMALEKAGVSLSDLPALVRHAVASENEENAAKYAARAADIACAAMAFEQGADFYRTALHHGQHDLDQRRALQLRLAQALASAGRGPEAARAFLEVAEGAPDSLVLSCRQNAAEQWLITGHLDAGLSQLRLVLSSIGQSIASTPKRALASLLWQRARLRLRGTRWREKREDEIDPADLTRLDVLKAAALGLATVDTIRAADFNVRFLRRALAAGEPTRVGLGLGMEAIFLATQGVRQRRRARAFLEQLVAAGRATEEAYVRAFSIGTQGEVDYFLGDFEPAEVALAESESLFVDCPGATFELSAVRVFRLFCLLRLGDLSLVRRLSGDYLRDAQRRGDRYQETTLRRSIARFAHLTNDDPEAASADLAETEWTSVTAGFHLQHWYELETRTELALFSGSREASMARTELAPMFDGLQRSLLLRIQVVRVQALFLRGRLGISAAALGGVDATRLRKRAVADARRLSREKVAHASAFAGVLLAAAAAQEGDRDKQERLLRRALATASASSMSYEAAALRYHLGSLVGGDEGAELVREANSWAEFHEVKNAARMFNLAAPGFSESS